MEKLEKKLEELFYEKYLTGRFKNQAKEVKDIAIAFAVWKDKIPDDARFKKLSEFGKRFKSNEELFNDFIQTYYSPTPEV